MRPRDGATGKRESIHQTSNGISSKPPVSPASRTLTRDSVSPVPAPVGTVKTGKGLEAAEPAVSASQEPTLSHESLHALGQPPAIVPKLATAAVSPRDEPAIPFPTRSFEPERHDHLADVEATPTRDKIALASLETAFALTGASAFRAEEGRIMGKAEDETKNDPMAECVSNDLASLLDKKTFSDSVTLSELLRIDRALVSKLQGPSAASLAAALHYVRASAIFFRFFRLSSCHSGCKHLQETQISILRD